jgi:hypothetical protein
VGVLEADQPCVSPVPSGWYGHATRE